MAKKKQRLNSTSYRRAHLHRRMRTKFRNEIEFEQRTLFAHIKHYGSINQYLFEIERCELLSRVNFAIANCKLLSALHPLRESIFFFVERNNEENRNKQENDVGKSVINFFLFRKTSVSRYDRRNIEYPCNVIHYLYFLLNGTNHSL